MLNFSSADCNFPEKVISAPESECIAALYSGDIVVGSGSSISLVEISDGLTEDDPTTAVPAIPRQYPKLKGCGNVHSLY